PSGTIFAPLTGSLIEIPDYTASATAYIPVVIEAGAQGGAQINRVEFYINGVLNATVTAPPYNFKWMPTSTGQYALSALVYDSLGNVAQTASFNSAGTTVVGPDNVTVEAAPAIAITTPTAGATISTGGATVQAVAVDTNLDSHGVAIPITQVQFFQDGIYVGTAPNPPAGDLYQLSFMPKQNSNGSTVLPSVLTAVATDQQGFQGTSSSVTVTVTAGGSGTNNVVIGIAPSVLLTAPANNATVIVNNPTTLNATASAPNGNIVSAKFLVDNVMLQTITKYPYSVIWTPANLGNYQLSVEVTDNVGDKTTSAISNVTVIAPAGPSVSFVSPAAGSTVSSGSSVTLTANASSPSGTIAQVQFFENGIPIGTVSAAPYTIPFTPPSSGVYTLTAIATDNSGIQTTSTPTVVEAIPATSGVGTSEFFGQYQGLNDGGRFAFVTTDGKYGTYISHSISATGAETATVYTDIPVSSSGNFSTKNLAGNASAGGVNGTLTPSQDIFIGAPTSSGGASAGYYTGSVTSAPGSQFLAIVGGDGSIMAYIANGSTVDVADGAIDSDGTFSITTIHNNAFNGSVSLTKGFLTGTLSGTTGDITAAKVSGGTFSDGVLKNISTRGQVGTGDNIMVAGFAVGGTSAKTLLIRAVGPTLSTFNVPGSIPSTILKVFSGSTLVQSNTGWSSTTANQVAITSADNRVGAFALPAGSADSALIGTFAPGTYTAQVSGVSGATGLALAEIYDLDSYVPFSAQRLTNVSTRGQVGTGANVLIGGFSINGTAPKRLLIRGAGPTLGSLSVSGALSAAHLQLMDTSGNLIRENYSWGTGNDPGLVSLAATSTGAFAFASGSADAAILAVLPPGTYTAILSGAGGATGVGLVEVYEVP
ncbi:MAG TPA: Ig-like domain-containing protein, partial [Opitutaceae bacterium]|nr:Ig-like domain-containing protein [Opitutaceae bacterium]